jgi:hypothetical protein
MYTSGLIFPNVNAGASSLKLQGTYFIHGLIRKRFVFKKKKRSKFWIGFLSHICDDCAVRLGVAFALNLDYRPSDQHHMIENPIQNLFYVLLFHVIFRVILFIVSRHALEDIKRKVVRPEAVIEPGTLRSVGKCDNHCVMVSCIIYTLA